MSSKIQSRLKKEEKGWEKLCIHCGGCCGAYDDPCLHLTKRRDGTSRCAIYSKRFGTRKTVEGEEFDCVFVKEIIHTHWKNDHLCSYKKYIKMPLIK